jgi:hypothetical protein
MIIAEVSADPSTHAPGMSIFFGMAGVSLALVFASTYKLKLFFTSNLDLLLFNIKFSINELSNPFSIYYPNADKQISLIATLSLTPSIKLKLKAYSI